MCKYQDLSLMLSYNSLDGELRWNRSRGGIKVGSIAGSTRNTSGYCHVRYKNTTVAAHRIIWYMVHGYVPECIDHIDGDRTNNRLSNLRECTFAQNSLNRRPKALYSGVTSNGSAISIRYLSTFNYRGKTHYFGTFDDPSHAAYIRDIRAIDIVDENDLPFLYLNGVGSSLKSVSMVYEYRDAISGNDNS